MHEGLSSHQSDPKKEASYYYTKVHKVALLDTFFSVLIIIDI